MRKLFLLALPFLIAATPIYDNHGKDMDKVDDEFRNIYLPSFQAFQVVPSTPNNNENAEGMPVIVSSGAVKLMFQVGTTVYSILATPVQGK